MNKPIGLQINIDHDNESGYITAIFEDGKPYSIYFGNPVFEDALEACKNADWDRLKNLVSPIRAISNYFVSYGSIEVKNGSVYFNGEEIRNALVDKIMSFIGEKLDATPLLLFLDKLMSNPSKSSVDELYMFLEHRNLPITDNGNFLAYKAVRNDLYDKYTGTVLNTLDKEISMPRNNVDDDRRNHCSKGYHAGTWEYASSIYGKPGDKILLVEINPADVVSVPEDYNCQKLRTCKYVPRKVVEEVVSSTFYSLSNYSLSSNPEDYEDEDYVEDDEDLEVDEYDIINFLDDELLGNEYSLLSWNVAPDDSDYIEVTYKYETEETVRINKYDLVGL